LLPNSVGRTALYGAKIGALWGLGHGISATLMGLCFFFLKDQLSSKFFSVEKLTNYAESAVGISLVAIGLMGIKESMEKTDTTDDGHAMQQDKSNPSKAIFANGLLHGFSLDGAPSIAPTIVLSSWNKALLFLASYSIGTMLTMTIVSSTIAVISSRLGKIANRPDLPKKLSFVSSVTALLIGLYWVIRSYFS
jgi:cytochrome c biogenesis protein CcdA